ncbi:MAG: hypothetical protein H6Q84_98 [Deltaproteobacteria bacterium]|nr:hypothetical protein [Deltaproteobacteria bacterium]
MRTDRRNRDDGWTRREFLRRAAAAGLAPASGTLLGSCGGSPLWAETFIAKAADYGADIASTVLSGLKELGIDPSEIRGKTVLLKPNLVEPYAGSGHINTHPQVVRGAAEAFLRFGASRILVAEGPGHNRDTLLVLEVSGLGEALVEDRIPFVDLNYDAVQSVPNAGRWTDLKVLALPATLRRADWIVSMPKMKTHHWAGVTLSMKNLFGLMPGSYYGWPKNLLHWKGIGPCILDINATVRPHFAIVDGIVGMEGDGPIMGTPKRAGVLVMGRSLPAVDATCARVMGIDPGKIPYLAEASGRLGPTAEILVRQRGERVASVRTDFRLEERIPAQRGLRAP